MVRHSTHAFWPLRYAQSVIAYCWACWRRRTHAWAATLAAVTALLAVAVNAQLVFIVAQRSLSHQLSNASQLQVYLADSATPDQVTALEQTLSQTRGVKKVTYRSKADALSFASKDDSLATLAKDTSGNPFPASLVVDMASPNVAGRVDRAVTGNPAVDPKVPTSYTPDQANQLQTALSVAGAMILLLVVGAIAVAGFVGLILMRGELRSRRAELRILTLVGTPRSVIRLPVMLEAVSVAVISTLVSLLTLGYSTRAVLPAVNSALPFLQLRASANDLTSIAVFTLVASLAVFGGSSILVRLPR